MKKIEIKSQYPEVYGFLGTSPCGLVMQQILQKEGSSTTKKESEIKQDINPSEFDQILSDTNKFIKGK